MIEWLCPVEIMTCTFEFLIERKLRVEWNGLWSDVGHILLNSYMLWEGGGLLEPFYEIPYCDWRAKMHKTGTFLKKKFPLRSNMLSRHFICLNLY